MTRSHFIEILMILTKYVFDASVRLTEYSVTVESITLRFVLYIIGERAKRARHYQVCSIENRGYIYYIYIIYYI